MSGGESALQKMAAARVVNQWWPKMRYAIASSDSMPKGWWQ